MLRKPGIVAFALLFSGAAAGAQSVSKDGASLNGTVSVGGQAMFPSKDIVSNAVNSADHTTLVAAVKAAGLVETLQSKGPFTVFAPTNMAFAALDRVHDRAGVMVAGHDVIREDLRQHRL
jgi:uncharacterized surface protein with fasciclin (FAS1) repeats